MHVPGHKWAQMNTEEFLNADFDLIECVKQFTSINESADSDENKIHLNPYGDESINHVAHHLFALHMLTHPGGRLHQGHPEAGEHLNELHSHVNKALSTFHNKVIK